MIKNRQFGHREEKQVGNSVCLATPVKFSCAATDKRYSRIDATPDSLLRFTSATMILFLRSGRSHSVDKYF